MEPKSRFNKNILIAVDSSANSLRAVDYVGQMLGGVDGFKFALLHIIAEPEEDFFPNLREQQKWLERYQEKIDALLEDYRQRLIDHGIPKENIIVESKLRFCPSMAECILKEREELVCDTIVVGRQGLSRSEEFLFGSISSKIVTHAGNCTVWVVE
ncbi:MAG: universal stress protein [Desulfobacterales bacterium]